METVKSVRDREPRTATSSFTQLLGSEKCRVENRKRDQQILGFLWLLNFVSIFTHQKSFSSNLSSSGSSHFDSRFTSEEHLIGSWCISYLFHQWMPALSMTSLIQHEEHNTQFAGFRNRFLTNRARNGVKNCCVYIFFTPILYWDGLWCFFGWFPFKYGAADQDFTESPSSVVYVYRYVCQTDTALRVTNGLSEGITTVLWMKIDVEWKVSPSCVRILVKHAIHRVIYGLTEWRRHNNCTMNGDRRGNEWCHLVMYVQILMKHTVLHVVNGFTEWRRHNNCAMNKDRRGMNILYFVSWLVLVTYGL